jgi:hypothetical protein
LMHIKPNNSLITMKNLSKESRLCIIYWIENTIREWYGHCVYWGRRRNSPKCTLFSNNFTKTNTFNKSPKLMTHSTFTILTYYWKLTSQRESCPLRSYNRTSKISSLRVRFRLLIRNCTTLSFLPELLQSKNIT